MSLGGHKTLVAMWGEVDLPIPANPRFLFTVRQQAEKCDSGHTWMVVESSFAIVTGSVIDV